MEDNFNKHLGNKLKLRRLALGLTQTKVAKAINVTFQQIQKYENGRNGCSLAKLLLIAKFLKKPLSYFISETTELLGQDISPSSNPIAPSIKENGINQKSKCH